MVVVGTAVLLEDAIPGADSGTIQQPMVGVD